MPNKVSQMLDEMVIKKAYSTFTRESASLVDLCSVIDYYTRPELSPCAITIFLTRVVPGFGSGERHGLYLRLPP